MMPRWVLLLVVALGFGLAGGFELRSFVREECLGPFGLEHGTPLEVEHFVHLGHEPDRASRIGPLALRPGRWWVVWQAKPAPRDRIRVAVLSESGEALWSDVRTRRSRFLRREPLIRRTVHRVGAFEAPGAGPLHLDIHLEPARKGELPEVRVLLVPADPRAGWSLAALGAGVLLGCFGLRDAWSASDLVP